MFESIEYVSNIGPDGLGTTSSICMIPDMMDNAISIASAGFDGKVRLTQFVDNSQVSEHSSDKSMDIDSVDPKHNLNLEKENKNTTSTLIIGADKYPILSVSSLYENEYVLIAYGGLGKKIRVSLRSNSSFPFFNEILSLDTSLPIHTIQMLTHSYKKRDDITWNIRLFYGGQNKSISMVSISILIKPDGTAQTSIFNSLSFLGHLGYIRGLSFDYSSTREVQKLVSVADDFVVRLWNLKLLSEDKITNSEELEGHVDDIIAVDCKSGWIVTGSKDKNLIVWDLSPPKKDKSKSSNSSQKVRYLEKIPVGSIIKSVILSDDATMIFAGCGDGFIRVYQKTGDEKIHWNMIHSQYLHSKAIDSLIYHQGVLITSSQDEDKSVSIWRIPQFQTEQQTS